MRAPDSGAGDPGPQPHVQDEEVVVLDGPGALAAKALEQRPDHLEQLQTPALILQGERDGFGTRAQVESYNLSGRISLGWLPDGDHSFKPRKASGFTEVQNWVAAVEQADGFCRQVLAG